MPYVEVLRLCSWPCGKTWNGKARAARLRHARTRHPEMAKELFYIPRCKNVENAHRATRTAGRLRNLLRAKIEGHRVEFLRMPWGPREGRTIVLCQRCLKRGRTVKALGECCPSNRKARTQVQSILEMRNWLDPMSPSVAPQDRHEDIRRLVQFLERASERVEAEQQTRAERRGRDDVMKHPSIKAFKWPLQDSRPEKTVYMCEECGRIHSSRQLLEEDVCESFMQPGHLTRRKKLISDFEHCGEMGDREDVLTALRKAHGKGASDDDAKNPQWRSSHEGPSTQGPDERLVREQAVAQLTARVTADQVAIDRLSLAADSVRETASRTEALKERIRHVDERMDK